MPSKQFSTDSNDESRRPVRPERRSRDTREPYDNQSSSSRGSNNDSWFDDADDPSYKQNYKGTSSGRRGEPSRPKSQSSGGGWDSGEPSSGGYEPYEYDRKPSSNRGRGSRGSRDGGGRGRGRGGGDRPRGGRGRGGDNFRSSSDFSPRGRGGRGSDRGEGRGRGGAGRGDRNPGEDKDGAIKTNLKMIENAGLQHLYGIAPVLNALKANVRDFAIREGTDVKGEPAVNTEDLVELQDRLNEVDGSFDRSSFAQKSEVEETRKPKIIKPEAKLSPHLFIQENHNALDNSKRSFRSNAKVEASTEIVALATEQDVPVVEVDKGVLNTLCGNRPHQGFVLRCGGLEFEPVRRLPVSEAGVGVPKLWLALDEVVDPQNLGALLRSAYFLGRGAGIISDDSDIDTAMGQVGILVCSKNSSPLTPTVSAASAGALEFMTIYSTSNLPKLLNGAKEDGWRILGAAAEVPDGVQSGNTVAAVGSVNSKKNSSSSNNDWDVGSEDDADETDDAAILDDDSAVDAELEEEQQQLCLELHKIETGDDLPTILVLGSEGRGLRTLVARACTGFVSVPGGSVGDMEDTDDDTQSGVDSLNVSVTGGILLWHFLSKL